MKTPTMMGAVNSKPRSVLYQKINNYGLLGYSMGGAVIKVANDLGDDIAAVIAMAPYNPDSNLSDVRAGCLIMVCQNECIYKSAQRCGSKLE